MQTLTALLFGLALVFARSTAAQVPTCGNVPPNCGAAQASVTALWPPNHQFVPVTVVGVTDAEGRPVGIEVTGITQDEALDASGSGATCPDATGVGLDTARVRVERSGPGDGRVYHVAFRAIDRCDVACTGEVTVCVLHDQRPGGTCGDGGPLYDSTAGAPPCKPPTCGPEDCVPDPHDIAACDDAELPRSINVHVHRAQELLAHASAGKGKKIAKAAGRQLQRAARRAHRAAGHDLSRECAAALEHALDGGRNCAVCSAD